MESTGAGGSLEVVVFPWLAFGHMIPFLELSKRLAARGHAIAFVSTPRNLARLPPVPADLSARLRFVPLPMPSVDGLPEGAESTSDVPPEKIVLLKKAVDSLTDPFASCFLAGGRKPDWIIHDFCHYWLPPIADEYEVPCAALLIVPASFPAFLGPRLANMAHPRSAPEDFTVPPKWIPFVPKIAYRRHEAEWFAGRFLPNASGVTDMDRAWQTFERCRLTIYRSCHEVEPRMFALLTELFRKPAIPAGILLPPNITDASRDEDDSSSGVVHSEVLRWLDNQPPKSVIYVALGTETPLTTKNIHELVLGLELAGVRFLCALRKPTGRAGDSAATDDEQVPAGFRERTRERGVVWVGWVPQLKVLAHGALGAFLTHCGWGSAMESFMFGHPLVMLPLIVDQPLIARAMVERGVGVEVERDERDGSFNRDGIAAAVRRVMVEDKDEVYASNAQKLREVLRDQHQRGQEKYIDELVEHLRAYKDGQSLAG